MIGLISRFPLRVIRGMTAVDRIEGWTDAGMRRLIFALAAQRHPSEGWDPC
jgi:hypothetical protein